MDKRGANKAAMDGINQDRGVPIQASLRADPQRSVITAEECDFSIDDQCYALAAPLPPPPACFIKSAIKRLRFGNVTEPDELHVADSVL